MLLSEGFILINTYMFLHIYNVIFHHIPWWINSKYNSNSRPLLVFLLIRSKQSVYLVRNFETWNSCSISFLCFKLSLQASMVNAIICLIFVVPKIMWYLMSSFFLLVKVDVSFSLNWFLCWSIIFGCVNWNNYE